MEPSRLRPRPAMLPARPIAISCDGGHCARRNVGYCAGETTTEMGLAMADMRTQIAATLFRPAPGGYVYREPYRWPFGAAPHYLVNEDQKAAIMAIVISKRPILAQVILWSTLCAMVAIACVGSWA